ncbi:hypothetical protein BMOU_0991 [Bifidobacterium moukalabense DSM 27321]|uniref:Uncharacterized protein n=1 Tax=Bifidobacterium moukalabense DSM 27321 TaxID=1435051 RepID=W4N8Z6_9BIFI|nr:hypothetical protein BMOU_0991 [Bifidobacterium moukalabense DSM 27321]
MSDRKAATVATQAAISKNSKQTKGENESKRPDFTGTYYLFRQIDKVYRPNEYIFTRIHKGIYNGRYIAFLFFRYSSTNVSEE